MTRRLHKRLKEHETRQYSAVYKHMSENNHKIDFSNPNILANDCDKIRLLVKESLNITEHSAHKSLNLNIKSFVPYFNSIVNLLCVMYVSNPECSTMSNP